MNTKNSKFKYLFILLIVFLIFPFHNLCEPENLIVNGGFENISSNGIPNGFFTDAYDNRQGITKFSVNSKIYKSGNNSVYINNINPNDSRFAIYVNVNPNTVYKLEGYILAKNIKNEGKGANLSVADVYSFTEGIYDSYGQWVHVEQYGKTGPNQTQITVYARLGGYSGESEGEAYFDDISLTEVNDVSSIKKINPWFRQEPPVKSENANANKLHTIEIVMLSIIFSLLVFVVFQRIQNLNNIKSSNYFYRFLILIALGLAVRIFLAINIYGYEVDMNCFTGWSRIMFEKGPSNFYTSGFCDYPPAYMYILWLNGLTMNSFNLGTKTIWLLIKLVPIICDMLTTVLIYKLANKKYGSYISSLLGILYIFNPAVLVAGSAWGQIDSVLSLLIAVVVVLVINKKWQYSIPIYILACLTKPQALMFAPIGLLAIINEIRIFINEDKNKLKSFYKKIGIGILISGVLAAIIIIPFSINLKPNWLIEKYSETLSSYPYASVNTANIYYLLSANWVDQSTSIPLLFKYLFASVALLFGIVNIIIYLRQKKILLSLNNHLRTSLLSSCFVLYGIAIMFCTSYANLGTTSILFTFAIIFTNALYEKSNRRLAFYMGFALLSIYNTGIRMHERYIFVAIILFIVDFIYTNNFSSLIITSTISISMFVNTAIVLDNSIVLGAKMGHLNDNTLALNSIIAVLNLLALIIAYVAIYKGFEAWKPFKNINAYSDYDYYKQRILYKSSDNKIDKKDIIIVIVICLVYSISAFYALGSAKAPQTAWTSASANEEVVIELEKDQSFNLLYYGGINYSGFNIAVSSDGTNWSQDYPAELLEGQCFRWKYLVQSIQDGDNFKYTNTPLELNAKYIKLTSLSAGLNINELVFRKPYVSSNEAEIKIPFKVVSIKNYGAKYTDQSLGSVENLIDEQNTAPVEPGYYSGTYFDEIYHARTAYEHIHNIRPYETSHPPLGKLLISLGVLMFGMTPFGFRFMGVIMGILMLPTIYLLAKQLFNNRKYATIAMLLLAFDCMHLTQTRIATIDSFPVFFILLSFLGMAKYIMLDHHNMPFRKTLWPLLLSGVAFGLACASKWIGVYAGIGLAVLFFHSCFKQAGIGNYAILNSAELISLNPDKESVIINASKNTSKRIMLTWAWCVLFFIIIPVIIYYVSYIPYFSPSGGISIGKIIKAQEGMLSYHSTPGLGADHPYQSQWWQWPFILKPMWYMVEHYEPIGFNSSIFCMGNPALYYVAAFCMVFVILISANRLFFKKYSATQKSFSYLVPIFISVGFLSEYLPWVLVPRSMFIYHYFASVPFIILATTYIFALLEKLFIKNKKTVNLILVVFVIACGILYIGFYPYSSGIQTPNTWLDFMKWFPRIWY